MSAALAKRHVGAWSRFSGPFSITGTVKVVAAAAEKPVVLLEQSTLVTAAATRSLGGNYAFEKIKAGTYLVIGFDDAGQYNAVAVDRVTVG